LPNDYLWGNREYSNKLSIYKSESYNTVYFGSSRILTGINPLLLDSLLNQGKNSPIKSFNLATPGTWANENFYLYEQFLKDTALSNSVSLAFMEFQNIMAIRPDKLSSDKAIYYQSIDNLHFVYHYSLSEIRNGLKNIPSSLYIFGSHTLAGFQKLLNFNRLNFNDAPFDSIAYYGIDSRGYLGLQERKAFRKKIATKELEAYKKSVLTHLRKPEEHYNKDFYNKCLEQISESRKKGIRLIFILPPVKLTAGMAAVYNALPMENKIQVCDPIKFSELYKEDNWIDETHLSKQGSNILNQYLAKEFITIRNLTHKVPIK
jgi:hypothetical protein